MIIYDGTHMIYDGGRILGGDGVDWFDPHGSRRTRQSHPYSYDLHYTWRDFDKENPPEGLSGDYTDRMSQWDREKYERAAKGRGWVEGWSKKDCEEVARIYYDGTRRAVGYAICANQATGYGIGLLCTVPISTST